MAEKGGGHSSFVRAHALAARRAGFTPHVFCASVVEQIQETDFGVVHRSRSPWHRSRQIEGVGFRSNMVLQHVPLLRRSLAAFLRTTPNVAAIHGFGVWGCVGVRVARDLRAEGLGVAR